MVIHLVVSVPTQDDIIVEPRIHVQPASADGGDKSDARDEFFRRAGVDVRRPDLAGRVGHLSVIAGFWLSEGACKFVPRVPMVFEGASGGEFDTLVRLVPLLVDVVVMRIIRGICPDCIFCARPEESGGEEVILHPLLLQTEIDGPVSLAVKVRISVIESIPGIICCRAALERRWSRIAASQRGKHASAFAVEFIVCSGAQSEKLIKRVAGIQSGGNCIRPAFHGFHAMFCKNAHDAVEVPVVLLFLIPVDGVKVGTRPCKPCRGTIFFVPPVEVAPLDLHVVQLVDPRRAGGSPRPDGFVAVVVTHHEARRPLIRDFTLVFSRDEVRAEGVDGVASRTVRASRGVIPTAGVLTSVGKGQLVFLVQVVIKAQRLRPVEKACRVFERGFTAVGILDVVVGVFIGGGEEVGGFARAPLSREVARIGIEAAVFIEERG